jgi:hypothetical protein
MSNLSKKQLYLCVVVCMVVVVFVPVLVLVVCVGLKG